MKLPYENELYELRKWIDNTNTPLNMQFLHTPQKIQRIHQWIGVIAKETQTEYPFYAAMLPGIANMLYKEKRNAPVLHFTDTNYTFHTPEDTGTGIAFKGLVVFDLAVMHLTKLPILVHDSLILKQISDDAIENILAQYSTCGKQIIIALDKQDSYSAKTASELEEHTVLRLAPGGDELFGRSWSNQTSKG